MRVIVAGTSFGRIYLDAVGPDLVGILARGSESSRRIAAERGVPLHASVAEVPEVDVACVVLKSGALGGRGTEIAREFLRRGTHVLQEHPVHADEIASLLREAREQGVSYAVNTLYPNLAPVRTFLAVAQVLRRHQTIDFIDAACNSQVLYPLIDILGRIGGLRPWEFGPVSASGPFVAMTGRIGGIPLTLRVQNEVHPEDPDNHSYLLHRITIGCEGGVLELADTHGPVLWNPRLHSPRDEGGRLIMDADRLKVPNVVVLGEPVSYVDVFARLWPEAVARALTGLHDPAGRQWALSVSTAWRELSAHIGLPALIRPAEPGVIPLEEILAVS